MNEVHPSLGYVMAGKYRKIVLLILATGALSPTEITRQTDHYQSRISKALADLTSKGLVVCVNPDTRKGKLYRLTPDGEKVCSQLACRGV